MSDSAPLTWTATVLTHVGKVRRHNEDACLDRSDIGMWCVADGMGGHAAGDVASRMVVDRLARVDSNGSLAELVEAAEAAILEANDLLFKLSTRNNQTSGSTVATLLAHGRHCVFAWAGDSRIYRLRDGEIKQMTTDHSQIETFIEQGLITREEARDHPAGNMVTRAVGAAEALYLDMDIDELAADDRYLLCSDGLDKHVTAEEIQEILAAAGPADSAQQLLDLTLSRGAADNVTVAVVAIQ